MSTWSIDTPSGQKAIAPMSLRAAWDCVVVYDCLCHSHLANFTLHNHCKCLLYEGPKKSDRVDLLATALNWSCPGRLHKWKKNLAPGRRIHPMTFEYQQAPPASGRPTLAPGDKKDPTLAGTVNLPKTSKQRQLGHFGLNNFWFILKMTRCLQRQTTFRWLAPHPVYKHKNNIQQ